MMLQREIQQKRFKKEQEMLSALDPKVYQVQLIENNEKVNFEINDNRLEKLRGTILLGEKYPFLQPKVTLTISENLKTTVELNQPRHAEYYLQKEWTPNVTIDKIIREVHVYAGKYIYPRNIRTSNTFFDIFEALINNSFKRGAILLVLLLAILLRVLSGLGGYSGYHDAPEFGDYEAQRHWMELTYNLPTSEWYAPSKFNDINWWKLDYPPGSAYISWVCGVLSHYYDPKSMEIVASRGYETPDHKFFMRATVLASDILFLMSAVIAFVAYDSKKYNWQTKCLFLLLILLSPPLILLDHGHFQYNCCMTGLTLWAMYFCMKKDIWLGGALFVAALSVKQMALYYALPFFAFILGKIYVLSELNNPHVNKTKGFKWLQFAALISQEGIIVLVTMAIFFWPWLMSINQLELIVQRIFPVSRGLYQLKVATFWCTTNVFIKWGDLFPAELLFKFAGLLTLVASLPSTYICGRCPKAKYFKIALFNVSMAFFFFSYHVHEKTILVPLLPFAVCIRHFRYFYVDFIFIATETMFHLFKEDKLTFQYAVITLFYLYLSERIMNFLNCMWGEKKVYDKANDQSALNSFMKTYVSVYRKYFRKFLYLAVIVLKISENYIQPPVRLPYLYQLSYAFLGFIEFGIVWVYSNLKLVCWYRLESKTEREVIKKTLGKDQ